MSRACRQGCCPGSIRSRRSSPPRKPSERCFIDQRRVRQRAKARVQRHHLEHRHRLIGLEQGLPKPRKRSHVVRFRWNHRLIYARTQRTRRQHRTQNSEQITHLPILLLSLSLTIGVVRKNGYAFPVDCERFHVAQGTSPCKHTKQQRGRDRPESIPPVTSPKVSYPVPVVRCESAAHGRLRRLRPDSLLQDARFATALLPLLFENGLVLRTGTDCLTRGTGRAQASGFPRSRNGSTWSGRGPTPPSTTATSTATRLANVTRCTTMQPLH